MAAALMGGVAAAPATAATLAAPVGPVAHKQKSVPVTPVTNHYTKSATMPAWHPDAVTWPSGTATVVATSAPAAAASATPKLPDGPHLTAPAPTVAAGTEAGTLPVWVGATSSTAPTMHVRVAPRAASTAAGVSGVLMSVARTTSGSGPVHVTLNYGSFADAFGGDWSSRLRMVTMPACALTTPGVATCRTQTPIVSANNAGARTVSADVPTSGTAAVVVAATSDAGGGGGDFTATSLKPSGQWQSGGAADDFSYSYPIDVPDVPGGFTPQVQLAYDSQSVDGLTSSTNNQASWIGDGWDYSPGFIERSYQSCQQNPTGATKTGDDCWSDNNQLTLSLNGKNSVLVQGADGTYHPQQDGGEIVQAKTGGTNGSQGGEYFVVTTDDGTQYTFGLNELPGFGPGDAATDSVWTEPVYSTKSFADEPAGCFNATFSLSHCQLAYRWNLDYVKDTHSDVVSYFYATETNFYAQDNGDKATTTSYVRSGRLTKIQYGQRDKQVYSTSPAARVLFTSTGRCTTAPCDPSTLTTTTAPKWPDVPFDLNCTSGGACTSKSPSFWSEFTLTGIETDVLVGATETPVDTWSLAHTFPAVVDPNTTPALWLSTITRTGHDTSGGGPSAAVSLPALTFTGVAEDNRVNDVSDAFPAITRLRLHDIETETGEHIIVDYTNTAPSAAACGPTTKPTEASTNTALCYPDFWTPTGQTKPIQDWFYKYIVATVTEKDPTGGGANDDIQTTYTPIGGGGWHYNDSPMTPTTPVDQRTWDQWRGFSGMLVSVGTAPDPVQNTRYTFFRGMNGDTLPAGATRSATVADVHGDPPATDSNQFSGMTYETVEYNGAATAANIVTDTVTDPFSTAATASQTMPSGIPTLQSFITDTKDTRVYTPLAGGTTRATEDDLTHDSRGRVTQDNDQGDLATTSDNLCTTTSYADNPTAGIFNLVAEQRVVSVPCSASPVFPQNAVSDERTFYDGSTTLGAAPTVGDITESQDAITYTGQPSGPTFATTTSTFDQYGRTLTSTDPDGRRTTTAYTPATGAEPTSEKVTDPLLHNTTTTYDPLHELPRTVTDPANLLTTEQYDTLGRLTAVYKPGNPAAGLVPDYKFTYAVSDSGPSTVGTSTRTNGSTYQQTLVLYDALLRERETQTQVLGGGRTIDDTIYNTEGLVSEATDPYVTTGVVSGTYVEAQAGDVPSATGTAYDGDGRKVSETAFTGATETWETTYSYGGDSTTTVPPAGGTASTTITDARGNTTDLLQYHAGVPADPADPAADYADTHYTYTPDNKQATVRDAAGNTWSYTYDLLGDKTSTSDPDAGTSTSTFDAAGQLLTTTDGRGKQISYKYDAGGRKIGEFDTTGGAAQTSLDQLGSWLYDTIEPGQLTSSTSNSNGDTVTDTVTGYTSAGLSEGTTTTITGPDANLLPPSGFTVSYGYDATGDVTTETLASAAGLPQESVQYGYDAFGEADKTSSTGLLATNYVNSVGYDQFGKPSVYTMPATGGIVSLSLSYDPQTQRLTDASTTDSNQTTAVDDTSYSYASAAVSAGANLVTSTTDQQNGGVTTDTQCFAYDFADRLSAVWTGIDHCAATPAPGSSTTVGGPSPYWQSWTYDAAGDRLTQTDHNVKGTTTADTTTNYAYPAAGSATDQPHTLTSTTSTGPQAAQDTASYTYDASGDTTSITGGTGDQSLAWTDDGKLASDTTSAGTSSYVYDADGQLVVRRDPGKVTALVGGGDEEIDLDTATNALTATRYYSVGDTVIAARSSTAAGGITNPVYLIPDRQGTDTLAVDSNTYAVTRRQFLPFGQDRTTTPGAWPGDSKGYVGGTDDSATGMENLGAREYDPATGRFLSDDPVMEADDPTQLGGYDYAGNSPVTHEDPSGEFFRTCGPSCNPNGPPKGKPKPKPRPPINLPGGGHITNGNLGDPFRQPVIHRPASHRKSARSPFARLARTQRIHPDTGSHWWNPFSWTKKTWRKIGILGTDILSAGAGIAGTIASGVALGCAFLGQIECVAGAEAIGYVSQMVGVLSDYANQGLKHQRSGTSIVLDGAGLLTYGWGQTLKPLEHEAAKVFGENAGRQVVGVLGNQPGLAYGIAQSAGLGTTIHDFEHYSYN
ncbi:MAG TPA: RHS repeat-associated core domain-containing protein [Pseudonocardiaceae bacterium]|nr:RHS repeat-associated core domain-containing protein [Pseudonocardiaceae bacterium]